jgi:hypothetical protein
MKKKGLFILLSIFLLFISLLYFLLKPAFSYLAGYLSKSEQVNADILIVEGWLPHSSLEMAYKEYKENRYEYIVTTGMISFPPYFNVSSDGYLIFYPQKLLSGIIASGPHAIEVEAYSELGGENRAHFNLYINDSLKANFLVEKRKQKYGIIWNGKLNEIDSIMVQFDNDKLGNFGDRNLHVKDICIDNNITIPYLNNSLYEIIINGIQERIVNKNISNAEQARDYLITLGIDSLKIKEVSTEKVKINRTLTSALAFSNWLALTDKDIKGINIITLGIHARRTWMTYNKILNEKYKIGIISIPDNNKNVFGLRRAFRTLRETLGIIYYWFILIPY